jgi:hypothetical protein
MKFGDVYLIAIFLAIVLLLTKNYVEAELEEKLPPWVIGIPYFMIFCTVLYLGINQIKNKNHNHNKVSIEKKIETKKIKRKEK